MGNAAATLAITIDQPAVYSGGQISGKVFMAVKKPCDASSLQLIIEGLEYAHVHWTTTRTSGSGDNRRTETVHHHAYARRSLVHLVIDLATFSGAKVQPGQYEYPFTAVMPPGLPSTMYAMGGGGDCRVEYAARARLHRPGMFKSDARAKRSINLSAMPRPPMPIPFFAKPSMTAVKACCCINRGRMTLGAVAGNTQLARGETIGMGIAIKNESTANVDTLYAEITEHVSWRAGGHSNGSSRTVAYALFDQSQIQGTDKLDKQQLKAATEDAQAGSRALQELHAQLTTGTQGTMLRCEADARDTYMGAVLSTRHRMVVRAKTPCCVTDPELELPVQIGPPPLPTAPPPMAEAVAVEAMPMATPMGLDPMSYGMAPPPTAVPVMALPDALPLDKDEKATLAVATALPEGWADNAVVATVVAVPMGQAVTGGKAMDGEEDAGEVPLGVAVAQAAGAPGTMEELRRVMDGAYDDLSAIVAMLSSEHADAWRSLFASLSPELLGEIVGEVNMESNQPATAELLAKQLGGSMCSAHLVAVLGRCSAMYKPQVVEKLAPLCKDVAASREAIESGLSDWERILVRSALDKASAV